MAFGEKEQLNCGKKDEAMGRRSAVAENLTEANSIGKN
jgi:hypothetical protein